MPILFYSPREAPYGCFSNFSRHGFKLDGKYWPTSEHYYQAQKFLGTPQEDVVRTASTPKLAAQMGRNRSFSLRADWEKVKDEIMLKALLAKFKSHPAIQKILLETNNQEIAENSPIDYYWGIGKDGSGKNILGILLMQAREQIKLELESQKLKPSQVELNFNV